MDASILIALRRFSTSPQAAADLVGVRITPQTYRHLNEYASLVDVHEAEQRATTGTAADRTKASEQTMRDHPELWAFYQRARMGID